MTSPQIRYAKSADGTRLAVWTLGEGRPLVMVPNVITGSIEAAAEATESLQNLKRLAGRRQVVQYDFRGTGLSSRDVEDFSIGALEQDVATVVDLLDSPTVDIFAVPLSGPVAISFAAHNPDRVGKLVLWGTAARGQDVPRSNEVRDIRGLIDSNWKLYLQNLGLITFGWSDEGRQWAESLISGVTRETYLMAMREFNRTDTTDLLPKLRCPTLIVHGRGSDISSVGETAAMIPSARLMTTQQGTSYLLGHDAWDSLLAPIASFLDEGSDRPDETQLPSGTAIILFADIVDSTALTERLGDGAFREKARELDMAMRAVIRDNSGTAIEGKLLGDGILAVFTSARQAIEAALACATAGGELALHLGIHAGDVIREENNVYGGAVNIAARISALSAPGEVLVSETVRSLARTSAGVEFEDRGEQVLKGVGEPVRVWAVGAA